MNKLLSLLLLTALVISCESVRRPPLKIEDVSGVVTYSRAQFERMSEHTFEAGEFPLLKTDGEVVPYQFKKSSTGWDSVSFYFKEGDEFYKIFYRTEAELPKVTDEYFR